jgi:hypothetical protein
MVLWGPDVFLRPFVLDDSLCDDQRNGSSRKDDVRGELFNLHKKRRMQMKKVKDKYDRAIEHLKKQTPRFRRMVWGSPEVHRRIGGALFQWCQKSGYRSYINNQNLSNVGCVSQIIHEGYNAQTPELTVKIKKMAKGICNPTSSDITVKDMRLFARCQRMLDKEIRGK